VAAAPARVGAADVHHGRRSHAPERAVSAVPESRFWRFSVAFYRQPGVAQACLDLQDRCGVDVNLLLYLLHLAGDGWSLDGAALGRLDAACAPWRESVVRPLRGVRRALKTDLGALAVSDAQSLRADVKRIELEAERLQQAAMERLATPEWLGAQRAVDRLGAAQASLAVYEDTCGPFPGDARAAILAAFAGPVIDVGGAG